MAYTSGTKIFASDFMGSTLAGGFNSNVWGTGSGSNGWGQTAVGSVAATNTITAAQWNDLLTKVYAAYRHENNTAAAPPGLISSVTAGSTIGIIANLESYVSSLTTNRFSTAGAVGTSSSNTSKSLTNWKGLSNQVIEYNFNFAGSNEIRWFFNANGTVNWGVGYTGGTGTTKSNEWATLIATLGSVSIKASGGTVGFYSLTSANTTIRTATTSTYGAGNVGTTYARTSGATLTVGVVVSDTSQLTYNDTNDNLGTLTTNASLTYPPSTYISANWSVVSIV